MADLASLPQIAPFVPDADLTSVAQRCKRWSDRFDNLVIAMNVTALLLHLAGEVVFEIFDGLVLPVIPDDADAAVTNIYTVAKGALDAHFNPKRKCRIRTIHVPIGEAKERRNNRRVSFEIAQFIEKLLICECGHRN